MLRLRLRLPKRVPVLLSLAYLLTQIRPTHLRRRLGAVLDYRCSQLSGEQWQPLWCTHPANGRHLVMSGDSYKISYTSSDDLSEWVVHHMLLLLVLQSLLF